MLPAAAGWAPNIQHPSIVLSDKMAVQPILIDGEWVASKGAKTFTAVNPATNEPATPHVFPVSTWEECDGACEAAYKASIAMRGWPGERFARYLEAFANRECLCQLLVRTSSAA